MRRLALVRRTRPFGLGLEQLPRPGAPVSKSDEQADRELVARLRKYWVRVDERRADPRRELGLWGAPVTVPRAER